MKNILLMILVVVAYTLSITSTSLAQNTDEQMNDGFGNPVQESQNFEQSNPQNLDQGQGGGQTLADENTLADWWWVLPLLAIPVVIYLLTRRGDKADAQRDYKYDR